MAVSPDGSLVFVVNFYTNGVIRTASNTIIATLPVGTQPSPAAVTPDGNFLFLTNNGSNDGCNALLALPLIILPGGYTATYAGNSSHQPATAHGGVISV
ncbi:YncE family protein [Streptomyces tubercidicus]